MQVQIASYKEVIHDYITVYSYAAVFAVSLIWCLKPFYALKNMQIGVQLTRSIAEIIEFVKMVVVHQK